MFLLPSWPSAHPGQRQPRDPKPDHEVVVSGAVALTVPAWVDEVGCLIVVSLHPPARPNHYERASHGCAGSPPFFCFVRCTRCSPTPTTTTTNIPTPIPRHLHHRPNHTQTQTERSSKKSMHSLDSAGATVLVCTAKCVPWLPPGRRAQPLYYSDEVLPVAHCDPRMPCSAV